MNKQNFESQDRFPLSIQSLAFMQDMIFSAANLARIGGDNYILSGCVKTGSNVTDGVIVINSEVMPFKGGVEVNTITIMEESTNIEANGLKFEKARVKRYATFASGQGATYYPWVNFKPLATNKELLQDKATVQYVDSEIDKLTLGSIPVGVIVMWGGDEASIPNGWALCDGRKLSDGRILPNLSGRFVVGYNRDDNDYNQIKKVGGTKEVILKEDQLPRHKHEIKDYYRRENYMPRPEDSKNGYGYDDAGGKGEGDSGIDGSTRYFWYKKHDSGEIGLNSAHENRPPYFVLAYIIKL